MGLVSPSQQKDTPSRSDRLQTCGRGNPQLVDYKILSVRKMPFGQVTLADPFFDSFRHDYAGFDKWFNKKSDETAYVCLEQTSIAAFLYLKPEGPGENYSDIEPTFKRKRATTPCA